MSHLARLALATGLVLGLGLGVGLLACGPGSEPATPEAPTGSAPSSAREAAPSGGAEAAAGAKEEAAQIFATRCFTCHGATGAGDGPGSTGLTPRPRDLQDPAWQESVSDEHIEQIIQYGGAAVGLSPAMPGNPDLMSKPDVVAALRAHIRGLAPR